MKLRKSSVASKYQLSKSLVSKNGSTVAKDYPANRYTTICNARPPWMHNSSLTRVNRPSGKGRFGKRATPIPICLEYERHTNDNSNDSGFECDWNSQSESQFGWSYTNINNTNSNSLSNLTEVEDSSSQQATSPVSIIKFLDTSSLEQKGEICQRPAAKFEFDVLKNVGDNSGFLPMKEVQEDYTTPSDHKTLSLLGKGTMSPESDMRSPTMPLKGSNDTTVLRASGSSSDGSSSTPSPVPVKRPKFCFSPPTPSNNNKGTGLKLRNQNGVQMRGSVGKRLPPGTTPTLTSPLAPVSRDGRVHLQILAQPEEQHRARYQTEGSRGAIKDRKCNGFPTVKLFGYDKPATLQIFIGTDQGKVSPHMFYQACKVTGKSSTPCIEKKVEGTIIIEIEFEPSKDMVISCDCVGILKERNVDVEQRFPFHHASATQSRKKSTKCRMIFRTTIINSLGQEETLQAASLPILCTQPPGQPEICKQSVYECPVTGGKELFIIGKNFLKDSKVVIREENNQGEIMWEAKGSPIKDYLQQTHLICVLPGYKDPNITTPVDCKISVWSGGKLSEPHRFTYIPNISSAASLGLLNSSPCSSSDSSSSATVLQTAVGHSLSNDFMMSPIETECQQLIPVEIQMQGVVSGMSPEPLVGSSVVSPPPVISSVCHLSPSSMDSSATQACSPTVEQTLVDVIPPHTTIGQITPISFESSMMSSTATSTQSFSAVEELKTLLEQTTHADVVSGQCQDVSNISDVKTEDLLSSEALLDIKPSTTFTTLSPNMSTMEMPFQNDGPPRISTATTSSSFTQMGSHYQVDPLMSTVPIPQLMNNSSPGSSMVNDNNSQQHLLPIISSASVVTGPTTMEGHVSNQMQNQINSMNAMNCMDPMLKNEGGQQQQIIRTVAGGQQGVNPVVFINGVNGELQGPIANALTQMSDNELINYINPSCFDQGSF